MNSAKTKSLCSKSNWNNVPCADKGSKMECQSVRNRSTSSWTPQSMAEQWRNGENLSWRSCTNKSLKTGWLEPKVRYDRRFRFLLPEGDCMEWGREAVLTRTACLQCLRCFTYHCVKCQNISLNCKERKFCEFILILYESHFQFIQQPPLSARWRKWREVHIFVNIFTPAFV